MSMRFWDNDLLDRKDFVDKMITVTEIQSKNRKNICYAVDGRWGIGKSYILEMYKERLREIRSEDTGENRYIIFQYNCWEYDYYEEPLIAILVAMLDALAENKDEISPELSSRIMGILKVIGKCLLSKGGEIIKEKTGVDVGTVAEKLHEGMESGTKDFLISRDFDKYINFKGNLQLLRKTICKLTEDKTVVFMVDELDRCLPEYAIKVLERLHHVFDGIPNMQVILSIDKLQLEQTVKKIYGVETDVDRYLAKFIYFDLKLEEGTFNDKFNEKFDYYLGKFDYYENQTNPSDIDEFNSIIFEGIDIRKRIAIIDKCTLLHNIINKEDGVIDYSHMCIELFLSILYHYGIDFKKDATDFTMGSLFKTKKVGDSIGGLEFLREKYIQGRSNGEGYIIYDRGQTYIRVDNIWGLLLACYRYAIGFRQDHLLSDFYEISDYLLYTKKYWELLCIIN